MSRCADSGHRRGLAALLILSVLLSFASFAEFAHAQSSIAFVQGNWSAPQGSTTSVSVAFPAAQTTGDLNVVVVGWNDTNAQVQSVTDSRGNSYARAVGPTTRTNLGSQSIYYSANIVAGANTVTVRFSSSAQYPDIRIAEYRGIATTNPVDVAVGAQGNNDSLSDSGTATTTNADDLLVGANLVAQQTVAAGSGFTNRMITTPDGDILEDRIVTSVGSYNATALLTGGSWIMQMVAFRAAPPPDVQPPTPPESLSASAVSSAQMSLTWTASSDNVGVTNYLIERCQGVGCGTFVQIGSSSTAAYSDTSVAASTSYVYRVRATDAAANLSGYSNTASGTTPAPPDVQAPTAPANLVATAASTTQVNLTWTASSDNVGVTNYLIERCQGTGCSSFVQIATSGAPNYTDGSVAGSATYTYRVRAQDAALNLSGYSAAATTTTPTAPAVITLMQSASSDAGVTASAALAFTSANTAGNWIAVAIRAGQAGQSFTVTDSRGNTYRQAVRLDETTDGTTLALFYSENVAGGSNTVTVSDSIPGGTLRFAILEYSGVASASSLDVTAAAQGTGASASSGSAITTTAGELALGIVSSANGLTFTAGAGYAVEAQVPAAPNTKLLVEDQRRAVAGSVAANATLSTSDNWGAVLATFRPVAALLDTEPPTSPGGLTATAGSNAQVNLSWVASSDNVAVTNYLIERCQGNGCSAFVQIATASTVSYVDASIAPSTTYIYRVRATDAASNLSGYSNTAIGTTPTPPDTQVPTPPSSLSATAASATQVSLSWVAATDNVGVTNYLVERCQGQGCAGFAQVGTTGGVSYTDATVTASTSYSYRVRATDAAANLSSYSNSATVTTPAPPSVISLVQAVGFDAGVTTISSLAFAANNTAGNWIAVAIRAGQSGQTFAVSDTRGNTYQRAVQLNETVDGTTIALFYAENIVGGPNTVTVSDSLPGGTLRLSILEYTGVASANSLDVTAVGQGTSALPSTSAVTTATSGELVLGLVSSANGLTFTPSSGFSTRVQVPVAPNTKLLVEDRRQVVAGPIAAAAMLSGSDDWGAVVATFRPGAPPPDTQAPTSPSALTATATSSAQVNLAWSAATDNVGVTNYFIERCQGLSCTSFLPLATSIIASYVDGSVNAGTSYAYRVRATDAASNLSGFSNTASVTTPAPPDTSAPTPPASLSASAASSTRIDLTWAASSDNVAVTNYLVERCEGTGCSTFAQIATTAAPAYSDTTVTETTSYSYRVRASDAASNLSSYSNVATANTPSTSDTQPPSAPGFLTAAVISGTRVDLSWIAATDNVGVTGYRVERCQGADCTLFIKLATPTGTTFSDVGLSPNTTYRYLVLATDAAGNLGPYSNPVTVTTTETIPELVAAYSFNEGTGITVHDTSGRANDGSIATAAWSAEGKYGGSLSFNGSTARVVIPDNPTLRLTTALTLEAWVKPAVVNSAWRDVIYKGDDNYFLVATTGTTGQPGAGLTLGSSGSTVVLGPSSLPVGTWTHLAQTYDGTTIRLYVNGVQVASTPKTGLVFTSPNPLEIGGDSIYGQFFSGLIDEVRVFNVARTPTQIQSDMSTPLVSGIASAALNPTAIDFGKQAKGLTTSPRTVTLSNSGSAALTLSGIAITGVNASEFAETNTCDVSLDPGSSCTISVTFGPGAIGSRTAQITVQDDAPGAPHIVLLQGTGVEVLVAPAIVTMTPGSTQQFNAMSSDAAAYAWSVDGVEGGSIATGTISETGLYSAPSSLGNHTISATTFGGLQSGSATVYVVRYQGTFTAREDNARTGANLNETVLTPTTVSPARFGKLRSFDIDGEAYASPLYVPAVDVPGAGVHNIVYIATEHNSVYAFDADGLVTAPLWRVSFINPAAGVTTVSPTDVGECCDITPEIGISGTPVIDAPRGILYVVAKTKQVVGNTTNYVQRLHALDLATGAERLGGPVVIQASVPGTGAGTAGGQVAFSALTQNQRPALLLQNGVVYVAFGSHGDRQPYHGWVIGYDAATLQQTVAYNATRNGEGAGVWIAESGPAADAAGNVYFVTGDGTFDANIGGTSFGDSYLKMSPQGSVVDYFTPHDQGILDSNNIDLGSGGIVLLPDQPGAHPHLMVSAGKNGTIDLIDRDNMGHYQPNNDNQIVQSLINVFPFGTPEPGNYSAPVYFNGTLYFSPVSDNIQAFSLSNGLLSTTPTSRSSEIFAYPGGTIALSASGDINGILWAVERRENGSGALRAYDATNLAIELYHSDQAGPRDTLDAPNKFSAPIIANGKVYVASKTKLTIFGLFQ